MPNKRIAALLGSLLLLASTVPLAVAHLNPTGSETSALFSNGDRYRWSGTTPSASDGVSGSYVNDDPDVFLASYLIPAPMMSYQVSFFGPYISPAFAFCDLEVLSDGTGGPDQVLDEADIDGYPTGGVMPDGIWDDGGVGGACHTADSHYDFQEYNTPGCGTGGSHAVAEDLVTLSHVWISAACDQITFGGDPRGLASCLVNGSVTGAETSDYVDCTETFVNGVLSPFFTCGSDGVVDAINYGTGGGSGSLQGVSFPNPSFCDPWVGASVVFTHHYVSDSADIVPATVGWIDSRNGLSDSTPSGPPGILAAPECSDVDDNDGDGAIDSTDDGCRIDILGVSMYNPLDDTES